MNLYNSNQANIISNNTHTLKKTISIQNKSIYIEKVLTSEYISHLSIDEELKNFRQPKHQQQALMNIINIPKSKVFIARYQHKIIGYITFHPPDKYTRWSKHPLVLELGAIEVSQKWRKCKIAQHLLEVSFNSNFVEKYIIVSFVFCWNWDLQSTRLSPWEYQKILVKLFSSVGLEKFLTDDPDVLEHPANVMMVRFGKEVPKESIEEFKKLAFLNKYH